MSQENTTVPSKNPADELSSAEFNNLNNTVNNNSNDAESRFVTLSSDLDTVETNVATLSSNLGSTNEISQGDTAVTVTDTGSDGNIEFKTDNVVRWNIDSSGNLIPNSNASFDIGEAENKVRHLYLSDNSLKFVDNSNVEYSLSVSDGDLFFDGQAVSGTTEIVQVETISDNVVNINTDDDYHEIDLETATADVSIVVDSSDTLGIEGHQTLAKVIQGSTARNVSFSAGNNILTVDSSVADLSTEIPSAADYAVLKFIQFRNRLCVVSADYFTSPAQLPELDLYIIAGQSNAGGQALTTSLGSSAPTSGDLTGMDALYYASWHNFTNDAESTQHYSSISSTTDLGYTVGESFETTLTQNTLFGPEIGFVHQALANNITSNKLAVMKYSVDGSGLTNAIETPSGISDWDTQNSGNKIGDAWRGFQSAIADAIPKFQAEGYNVNIKGMIWWQGENGTDAANLNTFISEVRSLLGSTYNVPNSSEFPFVITGQEPGWGTGLESGVADLDPYVNYIDTLDYGQSASNIHIGSGQNGQSTDVTGNNINDMLDIGFAYADSMQSLVSADWTPAELQSSGTYWWDASDTSYIADTSGTVNTWTDKNQGLAFTQFSSNSTPVTNLSSKNSYNVIDFDGSQRMVVSTSDAPTGLTEYTKYLVWSSRDVGSGSKNNLLANVTSNGGIGSDAIYTQDGYPRLFQDNVQVSGPSQITSNTYYLYSAVGDATETNLYINGETTPTVTSGPIDGSGTNINNGWELGTFWGSSNLDGTIAEIVLMPTAATLSERQTVEGYLAHKWGMTADLDINHPYKNSAPKV